MDIEQPALGGVGIDSFTITATWEWETGWRVRFASRPSGSGAFRETAYSGRDEAELHAILSDHLADVLGLL